MNTDGTGNEGSEYWKTVGQDGGVFNLHLKDGITFINNWERPETRI